mgnify:CR=1 FL=1
MTYVLLMIIFLLIFYLIIYNQINKIRKEYLKSDIIEEIREITEAFSNKANDYIVILEDLIKNAEKKKEELNLIINYAEKINIVELLSQKKENKKYKNFKDIKTENNEINNDYEINSNYIDDQKDIKDFNIKENLFNKEELNKDDLYNNKDLNNEYLKLNDNNFKETKNISLNQIENEVEALIKLGKSYEEIADLLKRPVSEIKLLYNIAKLKKDR